MKCPKCNTDNPENARFCGNCGTQMHPPSSGEAELRTQPLPTPVRGLARGTVFAGRYEIIEELGRGGMGHLFRVLDTKINQEVALKILRPEISRDKVTIQRFSNELKLARKISHKNVCRMYHIAEESGTHYITMEYIPGEDLQSMIRMTKQLSIETAVSIAKQISDGLAEAHRLGVVHRDLKPGNIMIDREGNARILDFGIALSLEAKGITESGRLIGTPEYMSPEHAQDKGVDHRSDIYSLGVILYEIVTGQVPFTGDTPIMISIKHVEDVPKDPKLLNPQIPENLSALILKCLEKKKEHRYRNAEELHSELERIEGSIRDTKKVVKVRRHFNLRTLTTPLTQSKFLLPALVTALVVLVVALILVILKPWFRGGAAPIPGDKPSLAILYFKNNTGDSNLNHWRTAITDLLITDLSQSKFLRVLSSERIFDILSELDQLDAQVYSYDVLSEISRRGSVGNVLIGNFTRAGDRFRLNVTLQDARTGELIASDSVEGIGERSFYPMVDELTRRIKANFRLADDVIASDIDRQVERISTGSPQALRYFTEGVEYFRQNEYDQAVVALERATEIDPEFAMAYESLGTTYNNMGYSSVARDYFRRAFELSDRVSERELYQIQGEYYRLTESTYDKAIEAYNNLLALYPEDGDANNRLGLLYKSIEEWDKAIERFEVCIKHKYERSFFYVNLAEVYMAKGMYERAGQILELYLDEIGDSAWVHGDYAINYLCQRHYEFAFVEADRALAVDPTHYHALWIKGDIYHSQGNFTAAENQYRSLLTEEEEVARIFGWYNLASLYVSQGKFDDAIAQATQGLQEAVSLGENPWKMWLSSRLAYINMKSGHYQEALDVCNDALQTDVGGERLDLQRRVLYFKGLVQVAMNALVEARRTADELKRQIDAGLNRKEIRYFYHLIGMIELARKNYPQAIKYLDQAISLLPYQYYRHPWLVGNDRALFFDSLATAYFRSGDLDEAQEEYGKIQALTIGRLDYGDVYAKSYYWLGKINEQRGWGQLTKDNYQRFLDLWRDAEEGLTEVEDARRRLARLR
jgi:serine/threonine protein kinase/Flp pilus assembly protein TadD